MCEKVSTHGDGDTEWKVEERRPVSAVQHAAGTSSTLVHLRTNNDNNKLLFVALGVF